MQSQRVFGDEKPRNQPGKFRLIIPGYPIFWDGLSVEIFGKPTSFIQLNPASTSFQVSLVVSHAVETGGPWWTPAADFTKSQRRRQLAARSDENILGPWGPRSGGFPPGIRAPTRGSATELGSYAMAAMVSYGKLEMGNHRVN